ncbi:actin cytoskeleton-regulatory complex protein PAN1-like [Amphibalanus amphitrite]|uniref:actin cytoskeleton-regulatory complex protein PAN1-like n=1 Tax=Amphibalanus amphitrite TaxID=1232801 RepID=UPI001C90A85E|nr:actin cytoskeleton-regulatory complex protein PAN1-like [Amphibalanus amphitrite]
MMTTGTSDGSAVTVEVKENGHPHSNGDSEQAASKTIDSSNVQTPAAKDEKHEEPEESMDTAEEAQSEPPVVNGRDSPEPAPAPPAAAAESETPPPPTTTAPAPLAAQQQPQTAATAGGGAATTPAAPHKRSGETTEDGAAKRARVDPNERATPLAPDLACLRTVELIESSLHKLKREVKAIDLLARQKEKEWDNLLKLRKAKEETFQRLRRKREVLLMQQSDEAAGLAQRVAAGPASGGSGSAVVPPARSPVSVASSLVQQQLQQHKQKQQQAQRAAAAAAALSAQSSHGLRPIRPAYGASRMGQGMGPQGPTISVQHLIDRHAADYRRRADLAVPLPASSAPAGQQDPQYREMLAQIAKLSKAPSAAAAAAVASVAGGTGEVTIHQVSAPGTDAASGAQPQSSLAKLLMESKMKQVEPTSVVSEMLKRRPAGPLSGGVLQSPQAQLSLRSPVPRVSAPTAPPPPPPATEEVPLCQGCQQRQAQFVCAGCGHQWYCSRDCQVEAWDSHADDCSG